MKYLAMVIGLVLCVPGSGLSQTLQPTDVAAIERAAATHVAQTLPHADVGFDGTVFTVQGQEKARDATQVNALARMPSAREVRMDAVLACPGNPSTCRLSLDALVRIGKPYTSPEGARVVVEVLRRSEIERQPVSRTSEELILSKQDGTWKVVGVGRRSVA